MRAAAFKLTSGLAFAVSLAAGLPAQPNYEGFYRFLGDIPGAEEPDWANDAQGLAHDDSHWFITNNAGEIWKIPGTSDLCCTEADDPGVTVTYIANISVLDGYTECKDPVCYRRGGTWYLFVPVGGGGQPAGVAAFRADTMECLGLQINVNGQGQPDGNILPSWCAIDGNERLVLPYQWGTSASGIAVYQVNWASLGPPIGYSTTFVTTIALHDDEGVPLWFENVQGGEFSPSGDLLYTSSGYLDDTEGEQVSEGLHVFDTTTWRRVAHSTNGHGLFNFAYDPDGLIDEEPQGLTVWDLDGVPASGIWGQLHVILLDNDLDSDDIYVKHYTHRIWVNAASPGGNGTLPSPYRTVGQAASLAWDGCEVRIQAGSYPESVVISRRARLVADGGTVRIGQ